MGSRNDQLYKAADRADFRRVVKLIREGADVNAVSRDGYTALDAALAGIGFVKSKVVAGKLVTIPVYAPEDIQRTVQELLSAGANPNGFRNECGSPLISASGSLPVLRLLVKAGANPNLPDAAGQTPLLAAVYSGRAGVVQYLLEHGADPRVKNREGKTALDVAKQRNRERPAKSRAIYEMLQKAASKQAAAKPAAVAAKPARAAGGPKLGIKDFTALMYRGHPEWSLFAVQAPMAKVAAEFARLTKTKRWEKNVPLKPARPYEQLARVTVVARVNGNPWTVVFRSLFVVSTSELASVPKEARAMSSKLKTKAMYFILEDTASAMGYGLYEKGAVLEEADWEGESAFARFQSTLRDNPELEHVTDEFADETFRWQGIYLPACYPRVEGKKVWVAVAKESQGTIERAAVIGRS